jgi:hypothetical protein
MKPKLKTLVMDLAVGVTLAACPVTGRHPNGDDGKGDLVELEGTGRRNKE